MFYSVIIFSPSRFHKLLSKINKLKNIQNDRFRRKIECVLSGIKLYMLPLCYLHSKVRFVMNGYVLFRILDNITIITYNMNNCRQYVILISILF